MNIKKNKELFIAPVTVMLILLAIYAVKGIYPFGENNVDYYDMNISFVPLYTHAYDVFHGNASLYYDWYTALGNDFMGTMASFTLSPFNLLLLFVKRDMILETMSVFLIFKMMLASITMSLYAKRAYKDIHPIYVYIAAMLYTFSGYVVQYYTNIYFLDTVVLFPLVMLGLKRLLEEGRCRLYLVTLVLTLISGPYLSIMVCIFIVIYSSAYLWFCAEKGNGKRAITKLGIYTVAAVLLSSVVLLPTVLKWTASARVDNVEDTTYKSIISTIECQFWGDKLGMLYGTELGIVTALGCMLKIKGNKPYRRELFAHLYKAVLLFLPLGIESINLLWHTGSYMHFPYRFGFILSFEALDIFLCLAEKNKDKPLVEVGNSFARKMLYIPAFAALIVYMGVSVVFVWAFFSTGITNAVVYGVAVAPSVITALVLYAFIMLMPNAVVRRCCLVITVIFQISAGGLGFIGTKDSDKSNKSSIAWGAELRQAVETDKLTRIKNCDNSFTYNYPLITGVASMSSWTNEMSMEYFDLIGKLGYGKRYTISLDLGGTALSDALLNNRYSISKGELNEELYDKVAEVGEYNVYEHKYRLPTGIFVSEVFVNAELGDDSLQNQNIIYQALSGDTEELIEIYDIGDKADSVKDGKLTITKHIDGCKTVYIECKDRKAVGFALSVNGQSVKVMESDMEKEAYPSEQNNGLLELGTFENEDITLEFSTGTGDYNNLSLGYMDNDKLKALCDAYEDKGTARIITGKSQMHITAAPTSACYIYIPVEYDKNWVVSVNGVKGEVKPVFDGSLMAVKLDEGADDIVMTYRPKQIYYGLAFSLLGVLLLILVNLRRLREWIDTGRPIQYTALVAFNILTAAMLVIMYVIPIAYRVYSLFS